jgi:hypothetical protein
MTISNNNNKKRTYTVVFMKVIGNNYPVPDFQRQYKNKTSAYRAISKYFAHTGFEAFIVRGDSRNSHKKKFEGESAITLLTNQSLL